MACVDRLTLVELHYPLLTIGKLHDSPPRLETGDKLTDLALRHVAKDVLTFDVVQVTLEVGMYYLLQHNVGARAEAYLEDFANLLGKEHRSQSAFPTSGSHIVKGVCHGLIDFYAEDLTPSLWQE